MCMKWPQTEYWSLDLCVCQIPCLCVHVLCSVFNIGSECFAPVAAGRPSGVLQLRRDLEARRSGREESVLLTVISTGLLIHW